MKCIEIIKNKLFVNFVCIVNTGLGALGPFQFCNVSISIRRNTLKYIRWICEAFILTLALLEMLTVLLGKLQLLFYIKYLIYKMMIIPIRDSGENDDLSFW